MFDENLEIATCGMTKSDIDLGRDPKTGQFLADLSFALYFLELRRLQPISATCLLLELLNSLQLQTSQTTHQHNAIR